MSQIPNLDPPGEKPAANASAITGIVLSTLGLSGWVTLAMLLLPYDEHVIINALAFGVNFVLLLGGSAISGTLSFCGLLTGIVSLGHAKDRMGYAAVVLGAIGLIGGTMLVSWRFHLVFG